MFTKEQIQGAMQAVREDKFMDYCEEHGFDYLEMNLALPEWEVIDISKIKQIKKGDENHAKHANDTHNAKNEGSR